MSGRFLVHDVQEEIGRGRPKNYQVGDLVKATVKLTNRGKTPINGITAQICNGIGDPNQLNGNTPGWGPLAYGAAGVSLAPGDSKVVPVEEAVPAGARDFGDVEASCSFGTDTEDVHGFPTAGDAARVAGLHAADVKVQVTNMNTSAPVAGLKLWLIDPYTKKVAAQPVTDAEGVFHLIDLQVGTYDVIYDRHWKAGAPGYHYLTIRAVTPWEPQLSVVPCP